MVICSPWGWDEVASYRSRRHWAERLASAGHPTLRFDFPACGDSAGSPQDPGLVESWLDAIAAAATWLGSRPEAEGVALLGLGLGGLLAREAIARGADAEDLILWGSPATGRAFVREARAFSAMQPWSGEPAAEQGPGAGAIEAGGFVLSAETRAALSKLKPGDSTSSPRRALLLERDGIGADPELIDGLTAAGAVVETAPGEGWGAMVSHPEHSRLPDGVVAAVERWLAEGKQPQDGGSEADGDATEAMVMSVGDREVRETAWTLEQPFGRLFGILARPVEPPSGDCCAVFLNAGAVRHAGPSRLWTEAARSCAARGIPSLRLDLEAIGESDGDELRLCQVGEFFVPRYVAQLQAVLDSMEESAIGKRFVLIGLCAGAFWSFGAATEDRRIGSAVLINSGALIWHPDLVTDRAVHDLDRIRDRDWWRRLLTGKLRLATTFTVIKLLWRKTGQVLRRALPGNRRPLPVDAALDRLSELGTDLTLAFSDGEALDRELEASGVLGRLDRWPNVSVERLPGGDHSLRPLSAQAAARELIDQRLQSFEAESRAGSSALEAPVS